MYVDLYSLGQGEVCATNEANANFSLKNLQVLRGYRFESIPKQVLDVCCGPLGKWAPGDEMPKIEIVYHEQSPVAYMQIPIEFRSRDFQKSGSARRLVPITNRIELELFVAGSRPYQVDPLPGSRLVPPSKKTLWPVPDMTLEVEKGVALIKEEAVPAIAPRPRAPEVTGLPADPHVRPDIKDILTGRKMPTLDPSVLCYNDEPGVIGKDGKRTNGILDEEEVIPFDEETSVEVRRVQCAGSTGRGEPCRRRPRGGSQFCPAHDV